MSRNLSGSMSILIFAVLVEYMKLFSTYEEDSVQISHAARQGRESSFSYRLHGLQKNI